jgi:hypothetical protein
LHPGGEPGPAGPGSAAELLRERCDLANALRAAWCAAPVETRLVLLALSAEVDRLVHGESM